MLSRTTPSTVALTGCLFFILVPEWVEHTGDRHETAYEGRLTTAPREHCAKAKAAQAPQR